MTPVTEEEEILSTRVYPNPSRSQDITADVSSLQRGDSPVEVNLHDMSGKTLKAYSTKENQLQIKQCDIPAKGIYLLKINSGVKTERVKLIVE